MIFSVFFGFSMVAIFLTMLVSFQRTSEQVSRRLTHPALHSIDLSRRRVPSHGRLRSRCQRRFAFAPRFRLPGALSRSPPFLPSSHMLTRCALLPLQLFTRQMFNKMGNQWALTFLAFLALVMAPIPFIFYIYGPKIRARATFAPQHKPAAPAAAAPPTASVNVSRTVTRTFTREEIEREEVAMMDLRQTESRREEAETLRKEGIDVDA